MRDAKRAADELPRLFKSYPHYKQVSASWLSSVPSHWSLRRLKNVISARITDGPHETPEFLTSGVPFLSVDNIQDGELVFTGCRYISDDAHHEYRRKCAPRFNDLLIGKAASTGKIARVKVDFEFSIWSPLALVRANHSVVLPAYLDYALKSSGVQWQIDQLCTSNTQRNISMENIPLLTLCIAPLEEQRAIIAFLDREIGRIDALIAKKKQLIALLGEKRAALITHTIIKGLDPHVPLKGSGNRWFGEIPTHWSVKRMRDVADSFQTGPFGSQLHAEDYANNSIPVINPAHLRDGDLVPDMECTVTDEVATRLSVYRLRDGDILFARRGEIGRCALVTKHQEGWLCGTGCLRLRLVRSIAIPSFYYRLLSTREMAEWLSLQAVGSTMQNINTSIIARIPVVVPPVEEQIGISRFLDAQTALSDALIDKVHQAIEHLLELRISVISAAVTGQIDVRDAA